MRLPAPGVRCHERSGHVSPMGSVDVVFPLHTFHIVARFAMGHGLPPQLLRNARGKWFSARCRLRRARQRLTNQHRIEALLTALASIDLFDVGMRAVYDLTSIFFFAYSILFLHLAMMPLPANSCDKDLPILNGAQYLVLFLLSGFVTVASHTMRHELG